MTRQPAVELHAIARNLWTRAKWRRLVYTALTGYSWGGLPLWTTHSNEALVSFSLRGMALEIPREVLTPLIWQGLAEGWYEADELDKVADILRSSDIVLELGTGLGLLSTYAARRGARRVVSVEANPRMAEIARHNQHLNDARVEVINAVAARDDGLANFYVHQEFWLSSMEPQPGTAPVRLAARSVSHLVAEIRPTVLIVDIEGGEASVFVGADLATVRVAIVEVHPETTGAEGVHRVFLHLGAAGLYYDAQRSSGDIVVFSRVEQDTALSGGAVRA